MKKIITTVLALTILTPSMALAAYSVAGQGSSLRPKVQQQAEQPEQVSADKPLWLRQAEQERSQELQAQQPGFQVSKRSRNVDLPIHKPKNRVVPQPPEPNPYIDKHSEGYYVGAGAMFGQFQLDSISTNSSGNTLYNKTHNKGNVAGALFVGYQFPYNGLVTRASVSYTYVNGFEYDSDPLYSNSPTQELDSTVTSHVLLIDLYRDLYFGFRGRQWSAYLGASVGITSNDTDSKVITKATSASVTYDQNKFVGAWALNLGMRTLLSEDWAIDFGYRFLRLGTVEWEVASGNNKLTAKKYSAHTAQMSFAYLF